MIKVALLALAALLLTGLAAEQAQAQAQAQEENMFGCIFYKAGKLDAAPKMVRDFFGSPLPTSLNDTVLLACDVEQIKNPGKTFDYYLIGPVRKSAGVCFYDYFKANNAFAKNRNLRKAESYLNDAPFQTMMKLEDGDCPAQDEGSDYRQQDKYISANEITPGLYRNVTLAWRKGTASLAAFDAMMAPMSGRPAMEEPAFVTVRNWVKSHLDGNDNVPDLQTEIVQHKGRKFIRLTIWFMGEYPIWRHLDFDYSDDRLKLMDVELGRN